MNKKKLAPLLLLSLFIAQSPSRGIVGGPFDNNTVPGGGADGTYSAVMTGENLTGFATFGIGSYSGIEGNGRFAVFHEGAVHYGAVSGTADLASKRVAAALLGVAGLPTETTGASGTTSTAGQTLTVRSSAEGAFSAFINGMPSQILFEGDGELSSTANGAVIISGGATTSTITIPTGGSSSDQGDQQGDVTVNVANQASVLRSTTPFKVRGSRTSLQLFSPVNSYSALPPLTPASPGATPSPTPIGVVIF